MSDTDKAYLLMVHITPVLCRVFLNSICQIWQFSLEYNLYSAYSGSWVYRMYIIFYNQWNLLIEREWHNLSEQLNLYDYYQICDFSFFNFIIFEMQFCTYLNFQNLWKIT